MNQGEEKSSFVSEFVLNTDINAPTELFFNEDIYYHDGYTLSVHVDGNLVNVEVDKSTKNYLKFQFTDSNLNGKVAHVVLTANIARQNIQF